MNARITTADIAAALGKHQSVVRKRANSEGWTPSSRVRPGGAVYDLTTLPQGIRDAIALARVNETAQARAAGAAEGAAAPTAIIPAPTGDMNALKSWQRETMLARKWVLDQIARMAANGSGSERRAIERLADAYKTGKLDDTAAQRLCLANARRGKGRIIERATVSRWKKLYAQHGLAGLAPKSMDRWEIPAWGAALLDVWQRPQKPSLAFALDELAKRMPECAQPPSYTTARRFLKRIGTIERESGRRLPRELKNLRPFVRRDTSEMFPCECYTADGHTFDAEIAHPIHGQPFRPEVTSVKDIVTLRIEGWSAGLAESTWTVADAWRNAVEVGGVNALFYVDLGSGFNSAPIADPVLGMEARLGATITNSLPYNSQARGQSERSHEIWVKLAKTFATYMGADMDPEAKKLAFKITRRDVAAVGRSRLLPTWIEFLAACQEAVNAYNARPHRSLPKIRDAETGRMRHMSPNEMREKFLAEGWEPQRLSQEEITDLFRPYRECSVVRGEVRLFNNIYFSKALAEFHGERVRVGYDIHDASRVWVRDHEDRLICVAEFEANKRAYFPQTVIEQAIEKRAHARAKRLEAKLEEVRAEVDPPLLLEQQGSVEPLPQRVMRLPAIPTRIRRPLEAPKAAPLSPADEKRMEDITRELTGARRLQVPTDLNERYAWHVTLAELVAAGARVPAELQDWFASYGASDEYRRVAGIFAEFGMDIEEYASDLVLEREGPHRAVA